MEIDSWFDEDKKSNIQEKEVLNEMISLVVALALAEVLGPVRCGTS